VAVGYAKLVEEREELVERSFEGFNRYWFMLWADRLVVTVVVNVVVVVITNGGGRDRRVRLVVGREQGRGGMVPLSARVTTETGLKIIMSAVGRARRTVQLVPRGMRSERWHD
jgi:hypothetical protein